MFFVLDSHNFLVYFETNLSVGEFVEYAAVALLRLEDTEIYKHILTLKELYQSTFLDEGLLVRTALSLFTENALLLTSFF